VKIPFAYLYRILTFDFHAATNQKSAPFILFGKTESRDDFFHENQRVEAFVLTYFFAQVSPERQTDRGRIRGRAWISKQ